MSNPEQGKQSLRQRLPRIFRSRTEPATNLFARQTVQLGFIAPPDMSGNQVASTSTLISASAKSATQPPPRTESPLGSGPSDGPKPQDNPFSAIGGLPATIVVPATQVQPATAPILASHANHPPSVTRAPPGTESTASTPPCGSSKPQDNPYKAIGGVVPPLQSQMHAVGSVAYEGLKTVLQGLYDCSDMFLPLKTAAGGLLSVIKIIDRVSGNKSELEDLKAKLVAITAIVQNYKSHNILPALNYRIKIFCEAIAIQMNIVEKLHDNPLWARTINSTKDADTILKVFGNISSLCEVFQIDTQLNIEATVGNILQRLNSVSIDKLYHEMTSYKTRHSSYGEAVGCMPGTRVKILADLDAWASDDHSSKVYWMAGMAGTGKSSILHTLCEILDRQHKLGASFFSSRASDKTNNARLIIPVIAHGLARASPSFKLEVVRAIEDDPALAEPTYINLQEQFKQLVYSPLGTTAGKRSRTYKIVVIDAIDECVNLTVVSSLIEVILQSTSDIPLKIIIASRDETPIRNAFFARPELLNAFYLHEVEKDVVKDDIEQYITKSLASIQQGYLGQSGDGWPSQNELSALLDLSGTLFIYAATAIRFIDDEGYQDRLTIMAQAESDYKSNLPTAEIDGLYGRIVDQAFKSRLPLEVERMTKTLACVIFLRNPLTIQGIASLLGMDFSHVSNSLSRIKSLILVPSNKRAAVAPFHASFPNFITDPRRCSSEICPSFPALVALKAHEMLATKCLEHMNNSLKYNLCNTPEELIVSSPDRTNSPENIGKVSESLKYSCLYWASHLAELQTPSSALLFSLHFFLHNHLLHWMECLSIVGELQAGLKSLGHASNTLSHLKKENIQCNDLQLLIDDARQFLQMNFDVMQKHCMEIYQSAFVWIPKKSLMKKRYATNIKMPKLILGLSNSWGQIELVMQNKSGVMSVAFSQDGSRIVSGSEDNTICIWNATTGEIETEMKGHTDKVTSVAFSQNGSRVVSGSDDKIVQIWNTTTGKIEAKLKGHTDKVTSVAFSQDGSRVVSGSDDMTVQIWNATTGKIEAELKGHTNKVNSVGFSQDGSKVVSGSHDGTVQIWNATTGNVEAKLKGHTHWVKSVAFSQDGSRVVSGAFDKTVRIWNATTEEVEAELKHTNWVNSVSFSQDGSRVVSGSSDKIVQIWNTTTGNVEAKLEGHTKWVRSVACSQDGSRVVSGSNDKTIRIWNAITGKEKAELQRHRDKVNSVALSQDGSKVVSGSSDRTVVIWNATTGKVEAKLKDMDEVNSVAFSHDSNRVVSGSNHSTIHIWNTTTRKLEAKLNGHTDSVTSVAFSQNGSRVVSGSFDKTVRIWNATTGKIMAKLEGHTNWVTSVGFSQDDSRVVSGSYDKTVWIWNATTGKAEAQLKGHTNWVNSVGFSQDGSMVVSGSHDKTVRIWDTKTGYSEVMTTPAMILPDGSVVNRLGDKFHIIYPLQQPTSTAHSLLSIPDDQQWIVGTFHACWIPPSYRNFNSFSFFGTKLCLGYGSGHVVILDVTSMVAQ